MSEKLVGHSFPLRVITYQTRAEQKDQGESPPAALPLPGEAAEFLHIVIQMYGAFAPS